MNAKRSAEVTAPEGRGEAPGRGRLEGRRILVVGAGQEDHDLEDPPIGNGRAMSLLLAREGAAVALADLNAASAEATAELLRDEGADPIVIEADAASEEAMSGAIEATREAFGGFDGLVMNVGIAAGLGLAGTSTDDWDRVMAVNARSHFLGCKLAMQSMDEGGSIVLIGSVASREVMPFPAYAASKAALEALCRQAAVEGAPRLRANLLLPGLIDTSLGRLASRVSPLRDQVFIPARRQGTAWEVAYGALYLLSAESSYVTGQCLIVDGGLTIGPRATR